MSLPDTLVAKATSVADRSWCRLLRSSAGEQVLTAYQARKPLADHIVRCPECAETAGGYLRLSDELGDLHHDSWTAPPDFVDRVIGSLGGPDRPTALRRSPKERVVLVGAAALSGTAVVAAAVARHRRATA